MRLTTDQLGDLSEAATNLANACDELVALREDGAAAEDRELAQEEVETAITELVAVLPRKVRPEDLG